MPRVEDIAHLDASPEKISQVPQRSARQFILHTIVHHGTVHAVASLRPHGVTVSPIVERARGLFVAEVIVPCKFRDQGVPVQPDRKQGY